MESTELGNRLLNIVNEFINSVNSNDNPVPLVLTNEAKEKLLMLTYSDYISKHPDNIETSCSICMGKLSENPNSEDHIVTILDCRHCFHKQCILRWLSDYSY